jgi:hypothetical protein
LPTLDRPRATATLKIAQLLVELFILGRRAAFAVTSGFSCRREWVFACDHDELVGGRTASHPIMGDKIKNAMT